MKYSMKILPRLARQIKSFISDNKEVETIAFAICRQIVSPGRTCFIVEEVISVPDHMYFDRKRDLASVKPEFMLYIAKNAYKRNLSVCMIHNHPMSDDDVWFSHADDLGNQSSFQFFCEFTHLPGVSIVFNRECTVAVGRVYTSGKHWQELDTLDVVGHGGLIKNGCDECAEEKFDRQIRIHGIEGQKKISSARVGVVGLGGIGSVVSACLAHVGVRDLVLVDPDRIDKTNLHRLLGACSSDIEQNTYKVDIAERYAKSLQEPMSISKFPTSADSELALLDLSTCDYIFCCTDTDESRDTLNTLVCSSYCIVIDLGAQFVVHQGILSNEVGKINFCHPEEACLHCIGHIDPHKVRQELAPQSEIDQTREDSYFRGHDGPEPSMLHYNMQVASIGVQKLVDHITGQNPIDFTEYSRISFHEIGGRPYIKRVKKVKNPLCVYCST